MVPLLTLCVSFGYSQQTSNPSVIQGKVNVKFTETMAQSLSAMKVARVNGLAKTGLTKFDAVAEQYNATDIRPLFPSRPDREEAHRRHGLHLWYELTIDQNVNVLSTLKSFSDLGEVEIAEPVYQKANIGNDVFKRVEMHATSPIASVDDPGFSKQWHYENDGTNGGIVEGDINLKAAWDLTMGSNNVVVSIHDVGIDVHHEDLEPNI